MQAAFRRPQLKAFALRPSSGYLPASMIDVRLDFKALAEAGSMLGSGAIVVCDDTTCMLDMASQTPSVFIATSPAVNVFLVVWVRKKMTDMLVRWTQGGIPEAPISRPRPHRLLGRCSSQAHEALTSICGLGP